MRVPHKAIFDVPLLVILVVYIGKSKASTVAISPLEVVHQRPGEVTPDINFIDDDRVNHCLDVTPIEVDAEVIVQSLLQGQLGFPWDTDSIFKQVYYGLVVSIIHPVNSSSDTLRVNIQPWGFSGRSNFVP